MHTPENQHRRVCSPRTAARRTGEKQVIDQAALEFPSAAWSITCFSPVPLAVLLGEGPAVLILRCEHLGELPSPLPSAWFSGSCLSCESPAQSQVQGDTRRNNNSGGSHLSSPGVAPTVTTAAPILQGLGCSRAGGTDLHTLGALGSRSVLAVLCPPGLCLSQGEHGILSCVPWRLGLWGLHHWNCAPQAVQPPPRGSAT